jgi:hypothetical protein
MPCAPPVRCGLPLPQLVPLLLPLPAKASPRFPPSPPLQDPRGPALVNCQLGCLHHARGELPAAVACFERFFELARGLDARLLDVARVNLGAARAALRLREHMRAEARCDLPQLLEPSG